MTARNGVGQGGEHTLKGALPDMRDVARRKRLASNPSLTDGVRFNFKFHHQTPTEASPVAHSQGSQARDRYRLSLGHSKFSGYS